MTDFGKELRKASRALRRAADVWDAGQVPEPPISPPGPDPVPPAPGHAQWPTRMMLGAEAHRNGRSDLDTFRDFQVLAEGYLNMRVTYATPRQWPLLFEDHAAYGDGMVGAAWSSLSIKPRFDGDQVAHLRTFMQSIPEAQRPYTIVTAWHEPEDNIKAGEFSHQEWTALQYALAEIGNDLGILTAACLMAWTWDERSGRNPQAYADGCSFHPMFAIDGYDDRQQNGTYVGGFPPSRIFGPPVSDSADWGIGAWFVRETGTALIGPEAIEWWSTLWDWAEAGGATAICPWDSDRRNDWPWCALTDNTRAHLGLLAAGG